MVENVSILETAYLIAPDVFVPNVSGEWIHPEQADRGELIALAENCPSGAIQFECADGVAKEILVNTIHVRENGPLAVKAEIKLEGESGRSNRLTLCRCGASKNKPYCDGSHAAAEFKATGEPDAKVSEPLDSRGGELGITPIKDGPFKVEGNLEICASTGHTVNRTQQTFLCRCGASQNKPYCDGSHQTINFKT